MSSIRIYLCQLIFFKALFVPLLSAQSKGVTPLNTLINFETKSTYALVVGISDYQHPAIPDLKYADKDAMAFVQYLESAAGGYVKPENIRLLLNQDATMARFALALVWLMDQCDSNSQAIIYFSGHGDVERKSISQPGFLLFWDSPANVYMSGGTFSVGMLQEIITTLSLKSNANVIVALDACRSGKLAGSEVNGSQLTNLSLSKQFAREIKLLSCQGNEYSLEGEQWGKGRGVFSYYLIKGLMGLADEDGDASIDLFELGNYLGENIRRDVLPAHQNPMIQGDRNYVLSGVHQPTLDSIHQMEKGDVLYSLSQVEPRQVTGDFIKDTVRLELFNDYQKSITQGKFLEPEKESANYYYNLLIQSGLDKTGRGNLNRNFAAILINEAQQFVNSILETDRKFLSRTAQWRAGRAGECRNYLERAVSILGNNHFITPQLKSLIEYLKAYALLYNNLNPDTTAAAEIKKYLWAASTWNKDWALYSYTLGMVYAYKDRSYDSCSYYFHKAFKESPNWALPQIIFPVVLENNFLNDSLAFVYLTEADQRFQNLPPIKNALGLYFKNAGNLEKAREFFEWAIHLDSGYIDPCINLGNLYLESRQYNNALSWLWKAHNLDNRSGLTTLYIGKVFHLKGQIDSAEYFYNRAIFLDSNSINFHIQLASFYIGIKKFTEANITLTKARSLNANNPFVHLNYGNLYYFLERYEEAISSYKKVTELLDSDNRAFYNLACIYSIQNREEEAFINLEKAVERGVSYDAINGDSDFKVLRKNQDRWARLVKAHFNINTPGK
ncbi:MAG: hypothetical protein JPMHGGIA_00411 [Saprospiraceae bacterium]|nr:hypothetical protein [Saprospiraceae bacterium]